MFPLMNKIEIILTTLHYAPLVMGFSKVGKIILLTSPADIPFVLAISITPFAIFWFFSVVEYFYIKTNTNLLKAEISRERTEFIYQLRSAMHKTTLVALVVATSLMMMN
jgi:hypothetical protein